MGSFLVINITEVEVFYLSICLLMQHPAYASHSPIAETGYTNSYNAMWKGLGWVLISEKLVLSIFEFPVSSQVLYIEIIQ